MPLVGPTTYLPLLIKRDVTNAIKLLHQQNLVFGDLRELNLLHLDLDGGRVLLVDFDVVGLDGEARYSACLNPTIPYCAGVKRGQIMRKEHDSENLEGLLKRLNEISFAPSKKQGLLTRTEKSS